MQLRKANVPALLILACSDDAAAFPALCNLKQVRRVQVLHLFHRC